MHKVLDRYEPDLVYMPTVFPCQAMESAGANAIDQVKTENLEAWKDTVFEYGRYR